MNGWMMDRSVDGLVDRSMEGWVDGHNEILDAHFKSASRQKSV